MIGVNLLKVFFNNYKINIKSFNIKNLNYCISLCPGFS